MPPFVGHVAPLQSSEKMALRVLDLVCMTDEQSLLTSAAAVMCLKQQQQQLRCPQMNLNLLKVDKRFLGKITRYTSECTLLASFDF